VLAEHPDIFSSVYVAMVAVAEGSGKIVTIFSHLAVLQERQLDLRRKVTSALAYPAVLLFFCLLCICLFVYFILPMMAPVLLETGATMPLSTQILLSFRVLLPASLLLLGLTVAGLLFGRPAIRRYLAAHPEVRLRLDGLPFAIPKLRSLASKLYTARLLYPTATMLETGLTLTAALSQAAAASGNTLMIKRVEKAIAALTEGASLRESLELHEVFPNTAVQMIAVGDETGRLSAMFSYVADHYDEEVESELQLFVSLAEPLIMAVMGLLVGFVVVSSLLPTLQVMQNL
jgi:type II secretory pathway component PulF